MGQLYSSSFPLAGGYKAQKEKAPDFVVPDLTGFKVLTYTYTYSHSPDAFLTDMPTVSQVARRLKPSRSGQSVASHKHELCSDLLYVFCSSSLTWRMSSRSKTEVTAWTMGLSHLAAAGAHHPRGGACLGMESHLSSLHQGVAGTHRPQGMEDSVEVMLQVPDLQ